MTYEEAIERLKGRRMTVSMCATSEDCNKENEALDMAIEALSVIEDIKKIEFAPVWYDDKDGDLDRGFNECLEYIKNMIGGDTG